MNLKELSGEIQELVFKHGPEKEIEALEARALQVSDGNVGAGDVIKDAVDNMLSRLFHYSPYTETGVLEYEPQRK